MEIMMLFAWREILTQRSRRSFRLLRNGCGQTLRGLSAFLRQIKHFLSRGGTASYSQCCIPISARKTRLFVPVCRNFDKEAPLEATLAFNHQVVAEDIAIVEQQFPEDLPIDLHAEAHFPADRSSIAYRKGLAALGLGRNYTT
jgi:vanillate O-demethylase monooxygenase subunit